MLYYKSAENILIKFYVLFRYFYFRKSERYFIEDGGISDFWTRDSYMFIRSASWRESYIAFNEGNLCLPIFNLLFI